MSGTEIVKGSIDAIAVRFKEIDGADGEIGGDVEVISAYPEAHLALKRACQCPDLAADG